jgi:hypothetical protein
MPDPRHRQLLRKAIRGLSRAVRTRCRKTGRFLERYGVAGPIPRSSHETRCRNILNRGKLQSRQREVRVIQGPKLKPSRVPPHGKDLAGPSMQASVSWVAVLTYVNLNHKEKPSYPPFQNECRHGRSNPPPIIWKHPVAFDVHGIYHVMMPAQPNQEKHALGPGNPSVACLRSFSETMESPRSFGDSDLFLSSIPVDSCVSVDPFTGRSVQSGLSDRPGLLR